MIIPFWMIKYVEYGDYIDAIYTSKEQAFRDASFFGQAQKVDVVRFDFEFDMGKENAST